MKRIALGLCMMLAFGAAHARGDAESGKQLVQVPKDEKSKGKACANCHGEDGNGGAPASTPEQPILAGQYYDYLVKALSDYKAGRRTNPIMKGMAGQLSKQEIEDIAAWFSSQKKTTLHNQR
jgi:cytochrome c553